MKPLRVSEDIVPFTDFEAHASEVFRTLRERGRPVVVTQNGSPAAVLLSPEDYDALTERARFLEAVACGLADVAAGRVIDDSELDVELDRELGEP